VKKRFEYDRLAVDEQDCNNFAVWQEDASEEGKVGKEEGKERRDERKRGEGRKSA